MDLKVKDLTGHGCGMLWSLRFAGAQVEPLEEPGLADASAPDDSWSWTHFPLGDARAQRFLAARPDLPPGLKTFIQEDEDRVQVIAHGAWLYGILPDFERDLGGKALEPARLFFACDGHRLLTARRRALCALDRVRHEAERGGRMADPTAVIAAQVLEYLELMEDKIEGLGDTLDHIEDAVLGERADLDGRTLGPLRRRLATYRRELGGLRSALHRLLSPRAGRRAAGPAVFGDLSGPIDDVDREAASLQDRARLLHEELDTLINSATNRSMRALTILSTLLIPPTLIVGAWGMNVGGIPWGASRGGFAAVSILCLAVVVGAWIALKRMRMV